MFMVGKSRRLTKLWLTAAPRCRKFFLGDRINKIQKIQLGKNNSGNASRFLRLTSAFSLQLYCDVVAGLRFVWSLGFEVWSFSGAMAQIGLRYQPR